MRLTALGGDTPQRFAPRKFRHHVIDLGAEDVAQVAPSFVFTNCKGEVEGVKYERLNLLLINAVKEQQAQIE